jgi:glycogen debranching enzyme
MFPEGESQGPLPHRRRHACGSSTPSRATSRSPATATRAQAAAHPARTSSSKHEKGTRFGIGVDPADGLLRQGQEGYQLTWMDAKVDGWVVTPRRGKAVEINALWYNALRLLEGWTREESRGRTRRGWRGWPIARYRSFNERFWYAEGGYLYDVVDAEGGGQRHGPVGPTSVHRPSRSTIPCSTAGAGRR